MRALARIERACIGDEHASPLPSRPEIAIAFHVRYRQ
jgi:hypothetical protein